MLKFLDRHIDKADPKQRAFVMHFANRIKNEDDTADTMENLLHYFGFDKYSLVNKAMQPLAAEAVAEQLWVWHKEVIKYFADQLKIDAEVQD